jgi:hypothetical protein
MRCPRDSSCAVACSTSSTSNSSQACGTGTSSGQESFPKHDRAACGSGQSAKLFAPFRASVFRSRRPLLEGNAEGLAVPLATCRNVPNDRTEAGDEQNPYRFTPFHITSSRGDERSYPIEQRLRCVMRLGADRCKALRHRTGASGSLRVGQSGPGDFIRCERRYTDPMGACS